jgi:SAM-dependent methyltransferase
MTHPAARPVDELVAAVRRGTPWREVLDAAATQSGALADPAADECAATWIWLAELPGSETAVVLNGGLGHLAAGLAPHFASVCYQDASDALVEFARVRFAQDELRNITATRADVHELPYRDASADCVAVQDVPPEFSLVDLARLASRCRRILRSRGCLCIGWDNRQHYRRLLRAGPTRLNRGLATRLGSARRVKRLLTEIGFRAVRLYYASPSHRQPENIVPATRPAVVRYEEWESMRIHSNRWRTLAARLGFWPYLYSSHLALAYT